MQKLLVTSLLVAACSDNPSTMVDANVQTADAPRPDAPADADTITGRQGTVIIAELRGADMDTTATAVFSNGPLFGAPAGSSGGCDYYSSPDEGGMSAGNIAVTGTLSPITLEPSTSTPVEYSPAAALPADLFASGATLTIAAAGATVPAFSGTVTAPAPIANPTLPATLSRANPPTITWTAGTGSEMWVWVMGINGQAVELVWCRTPDDGSFAVPAAAMAFIPAAATSGFVFLWRTNAAAVTAGAWDVSVVAADTFGTDIIAIGQ